MRIREYLANLDGVTAELYALPEIYACPSWGEMSAGFRRHAAEAVKLMFLEKEIFFFRFRAKHLLLQKRKMRFLIPIG